MAITSECTLGVDCGSTSTRAVLLRHDTRQTTAVVNTHGDNLNARFDQFSFSSAAFPFEEGPPDQPVYVLRGDRNRRGISNKYCMYPLAGLKDSILLEYPLVHHLMQHRHDPAFRARMRRGLVEMFVEIFKLAIKICRKDKMRITRVALTVPAVWTMEFEELYAGIVMEAFRCIEPAPRIDRDAIEFYNETEALAHFLFKNFENEIDPEKKYNYILLIDFGGHSMGGCLFQIVRSGGDMRFFRAAEPFGAAGGSEEWEYHLGERCAKMVATVCDGARMTPMERQGILDTFFPKKETMGPGFSTNVHATVQHNGRLWPLNIDPGIIDECWRAALKKPLQEAKFNIQDAARRTRTRNESVLVLVSGGTCRNKALQLQVESLCRAEGLARPIFTDNTDSFEDRLTHKSEKLAMGATYASADALTVDEFLTHAAIGLQVNERRNNPRDLWTNTAYFLFDGTGSKPFAFTMHGDRFKLICDPFFSQRPDKTHDCLAYERCFDVLPLGHLVTGMWRRIQVSFETTGGKTSMVIQQWSKKSEKARKWKDEETWVIPVFFNGGSNCVQVGSPTKHISEICPHIAKIMEEEYHNDEERFWEMMEEEDVEIPDDGEPDPCCSTPGAFGLGNGSGHDASRTTMSPIHHNVSRAAQHPASSGRKPVGSLKRLNSIDAYMPRKRRTGTDEL